MSQARIYDVSLTIYPGMPVWPGDAPVDSEQVQAIAAGGSSNLSRLSLGSHTGTHIDSPRHFFDSGNGIDALDTDILWGSARLFRLPGVKAINRAALEGIELEGVSRLLLATDNSARLKKPEFDADFAYLTEDAAEYIVERGIKLVGVDYLSVEKYHNPGHPVHRTLLGAGVVVVEGLYLEEVPSGDYELACLPLKIRGGDGSPARALLKELR